MVGAASYTMNVATGAVGDTFTQKVQIDLTRTQFYPQWDIAVLTHQSAIVGGFLPEFATVSRNDMVRFAGYGDRGVFGQPESTFVLDLQPMAYEMRVYSTRDPANILSTTDAATGNLIGSALHGDSGSPGYIIGSDGVFRLAVVVENALISPLSYVGDTGAVSLNRTELGDTIMTNTYRSVPEVTSTLLFAFGAGLIASQRNRKA